MPLDLDEIFEGMARDADRAELPPLESIWRRRRDHSARVAAQGLAITSIVAAFIVTTFTVFAPGPQPVAAQRFLPFDGDAPPVVPYNGGARQSSLTVTRGNVTYATWTDPTGGQMFVAVELDTLKPLWGPVEVEPIRNVYEIQVSNLTILAVSAREGASRDFLALDAATGKVLWQKQRDYAVSDSYLLYDGVTILGAGKTGKVEGVDRTGRTLWSADWAPSYRGLTQLRSFDEFLEYGGYGSLPIPADQRFVMQHRSGTLQVRDAVTGTILSEFATPEMPINEEIAIDGKLYLTGNGVMEFDLGQPSPEPRKVFDRGASLIGPCGRALLCVLGDGLDVIDPVTAQVRWREQAIYGLGRVGAAREAIRAPTVDGSIIYDLNGKQLHEFTGSALWLDDKHLLFFGNDDVVSAYSVATGEQTRLGKVPWANCSWNTTMLSCPTKEGLKIWRYRASE